MSIHLRNNRTGQYFENHARWTYHRGRALDFKTALEALDEAVKYGIQDMQLVVALADNRPDLRLPPLWGFHRRSEHKP